MDQGRPGWSDTPGRYQLDPDRSRRPRRHRRRGLPGGRLPRRRLPGHQPGSGCLRGQRTGVGELLRHRENRPQRIPAPGQGTGLQRRLRRQPQGGAQGHHRCHQRGRDQPASDRSRVLEEAGHERTRPGRLGVDAQWPRSPGQDHRHRLRHRRWQGTVPGRPLRRHGPRGRFLHRDRPALGHALLLPGGEAGSRGIPA